ncbi:MAG: HU family DNA-binding protein [Synergistaceae bacterium]|nr:HU family DNA-binding protein [Synergistaceae bacterium]
MSDALAEGEKCNFVGFGVFEVKQRAERTGRNPRDPSQAVHIPAKRVPAFRAGKTLKDPVAAPVASPKRPSSPRRRPE